MHVPSCYMSPACYIKDVSVTASLLYMQVIMHVISSHEHVTCTLNMTDIL